MEFQFGSGTLFGENTDILNSTPRMFGTLQDVSLDISFDVKELFGRKQFADDVARGKGKIQGKAKFANINGALFNDLFFGQTLSAGLQLLVVNDEGTAGTGSIIPGAPYQITVTNGATMADDLGVKFYTTGSPLTKVASAPAASQYSVNETTGIYTFASADTGKGVLISYAYKAGASAGVKAVISNKLMGAAPHFKITLSQDYESKQCNFVLYSCVATKLSWATKNEDYTIPEFDFSAFANAAGDVFEIDFAE